MRCDSIHEVLSVFQTEVFACSPRNGVVTALEFHDDGFLPDVEGSSFSAVKRHFEYSTAPLHQQ